MKITCKRHDVEFDPTKGEGCPQCMAERLGQQLKEKLKSNIVKVKYFSETTGELSSSEYSYRTEEPLEVGDIVTVPVRDTTGKAKVSVIDVPETEIEAFRDKVKMIPAHSIEIAHDEKEGELMFESDTPQLSQLDTDIEVVSSLSLIPPEADNKLMEFYNEGIRLMEYASARVITTNADLKPATDDLSIIARVKKGMEEKRKEYLKPFQDHVKETNEAYKNLMYPVEEADRITRLKILEFNREQSKRRLEAERIEAEKLRLAREEAELKGGEITVDLTPVEKPEAVPDRIRTELGSSSTMKIRKWELVDITQVPAEYLMIDAAKVTKLVKAGIGLIPGIRIYEEETLRVNAK